MSSPIELKGAQKNAVERIGRNMALLSGAGCGKTLVLARRYLELLRAAEHPDQAVRRFVALTFTEKAALEMSGRVRAMLAATAAEGGERRGDALRWLEELPEAYITTIHSFCASLLRTHAVEAGIDPAFAVCADELLVGRMIAEAAETALLEAVEKQDAAAADLLTSVSFPQACRLVEELVAERTRWEPAAYGDPAATLARWRQQVRKRRDEAFAELSADAALAAEVDALAAEPCADPADKLAIYREEFLAAARAVMGSPAGGTPQAFEVLGRRPGNAGSARNWRGMDNVKAVRQGLRALADRLGQYAIHAEDVGELDARAAATLAPLTALARRAEELFAAEKRSRGLLDFTDLLARAGRLLSGSEAVRAAVAGRVEQLLIDEAQDTDGFQLGLLGAVTGGRAGGPPREGRLFLVGDAKQSIYRFRGAQVEQFQAACDRLGKDHQETLSVSFRTHEAGVAFVNALFEPLMGADYAPIEAHRKELPPAASVELLLAAGTEDRPIDGADVAAKAQAAVTAGRIADMLAAGERIVWDRHAGDWRAVRPGDIAVLFARMTNSLDYERALQERGVPYYVVAGSGFFQRQEVLDVLTALRAVDDPRDDIALVGALRGGLFGLDDNTLMHLAEACDRPLFDGLKRVDLTGRLTAAQHEALRFAAALLERLHRRKDAVGIDELLEELLDATGHEAVLLSQFGGRRLLGNVRMVAQLARQAAEGGLALADFLAETEEMVVQQSRYEQAAVAGEGEDVVRLMTIHKAKGLEFPVVFVPDLNAARRGHHGPLLLRSDWGLTYNQAPADEADGDGEAESPEGPLSYRLAKAAEDRQQDQEDIRKLYVAATRHKDHLVFVGADWRTNDGRFRSGGSFLDRIDAALDLRGALDGDGRVRYGGGRFAASVRSAAGEAAAGAGAGRAKAARKLLDDAADGAALAEAVAAAAKGKPRRPALVGPLAASIGGVEIAVTALGDFAQCPMLYRWRHDLRIPRGMEKPARSRPTGSQGDAQGFRSLGLDAATLGTLYHKCMELLDLAHPQPADLLLAAAAAETEIDDPPAMAALAGELAAMLVKFRGHELWGRLAAARQTYRELDFVMDCPPATLRGQIDLLVCDAAGRWRIVDYKSDDVDAAAAAEHAARYQLQMLLYAAAAQGRLGRGVESATLYFLRPAVAVEMDVSPAAVEAVRRRAGELAGRLVAARREGNFAPRRRPACAWCPYGELCQRSAGGPCIGPGHTSAFRGPESP